MLTYSRIFEILAETRELFAGQAMAKGLNWEPTPDQVVDYIEQRVRAQERIEFYYIPEVPGHMDPYEQAVNRKLKE